MHEAVGHFDMTNFVVIPTIDNRPAIDAAYKRIKRYERNIERAMEFAALPFARTDRIVTDTVRDLLFSIDDQIHHNECDLEDLHSEHGMLAPTQETWDAMDPESLRDIIDRYVSVECITGEWEFNPWGPLVEANCPGYFNIGRD